MIAPTSTPITGILLSGGLDSSILLGYLLEAGERVQPFYVRCGLHWEPEERVAVQRLLSYWRGDLLQELVTLEMPVADLYGDHWSLDGRDVPSAGTPDAAVYLPGRNPLLLIKAAVWCDMHNIRRLALGSLRSNPFADATPEFFADFARTVGHTTRGRVEIVRPLEQLSKSQALEMGRRFPLAQTFSCLSPVDGLHCGRCNKCEERQVAFRRIGGEDHTRYALPTEETPCSK
jgi:7-cyano-7-deazaguanine synthase